MWTRKISGVLRARKRTAAGALFEFRPCSLGDSRCAEAFGEGGRATFWTADGNPTMTRVDVIVPCYNYGDMLEDCVRSILTQDDVDVRVIVMDDASSDATETV